jgi:long-chain alkane monooxygenase
MAKQIHLNAFTQGCVNHHSKGQWKNPLTRSAEGYRDIHYWIELARSLERGCFDSIFLADVHGTYSVYRGSNRVAIAQAVQFPSLDPTFFVPAMAAATRHLGFACTFSTTYFPPYHTAKVFSTLDEITKGRIGWNIVTSYLTDALQNFGIKDNLTHDQRYDRAEEYMDVVYKLWEHSWEEDAVVKDRERDIFTDPDRVHTIDHEGEWFQVKGPHMCAPSPQRTPVLFQAGASGRGHAFAGRHAEAVFMIAPNIQMAADDVRKLRAAAVKAGRRPTDILANQGVAVIVAPTDEEARLKEKTLRSYANHEGVLALYCGWTGIDLSTLPRGKKLEDIQSNAIQSLQSYFTKVDPNREWTLESMSQFLEIGSVFPKIVGSPATVADALEEWMEGADLDGFNLHAVTQPTGFTDFVDLVVPELQRRGRMRRRYEEGATLRELYFGSGHKRVDERHPAARLKSLRAPALNA